MLTQASQERRRHHSFRGIVRVVRQVCVEARCECGTVSNKETAEYSEEDRWERIALRQVVSLCGLCLRLGTEAASREGRTKTNSKIIVMIAKRPPLK